jgi:Skp family chaperone for outer membrane proteins
MQSFVLASLIITPLSPQAVSAPAPAATNLGGLAVPGLYRLSRVAVLEHAKVGLAATQRLRQLTQAAQAEIEADRKPIEAERKAYQDETATLAPVRRQAREQAIAGQVQRLNQKIALRTREIEATRADVQTRIAAEMQPVVEIWPPLSWV